MTTPTHALDPLIRSLTGAVRLLDWGVLRAQGPDAASFLQGQLTQDVLGIGEHEARLAGYCSAKGRLMASFVVWQPTPDEFLLACSADLLATLQKRLTMFVLRAKCKITDVSAELPLWGLVGDVWAGADHATATAAALPARAGQVVRQGENTFIGLPNAAVPSNGPGKATVARYLMVTRADAVLANFPALDHSTWLWLEAGSGTVRISAATAEQFVPQMVNFDLVDGVNFKKGCYPGQEVVARSQYRGTLKRRAFLLSADAPAQPGQEIFHSADPGQPAGMVALAGSHGQQHQVLAEMKLAALEPGSGTLHAGSATGPLLHRAALPYAVVEAS